MHLCRLLVRVGELKQTERFSETRWRLSLADLPVEYTAAASAAVSSYNAYTEMLNAVVDQWRGLRRALTLAWDLYRTFGRLASRQPLGLLCRCWFTGAYALSPLAGGARPSLSSARWPGWRF